MLDVHVRTEIRSAGKLFTPKEAIEVGGGVQMCSFAMRGGEESESEPFLEILSLTGVGRKVTSLLVFVHISVKLATAESAAATLKSLLTKIKSLSVADYEGLVAKLVPQGFRGTGVNIPESNSSACDEAQIWLNGYVNKQNCRIWSEANPQVYVETQSHPEKLTVWCTLWAGGILLPKR
ncbi:hypothetical protein TNCV_2402191 [Trichonephila clavipes]|nr:hypothetical protein TNCV_2402191 [Trichonephila clavipes]